MGTPLINPVPEDLWKILSRAGSLRSYAAGETLYRAGTGADGVFLIQAGKVSLRLASAGEGKKELLQKAGPGTILALSEVMSGERHKLTAKAAIPSQICFVPRPQLMEFLRTTPLACMQVVQLLSNDLRRLYQTLRQKDRE